MKSAGAGARSWRETKPSRCHHALQADGSLFRALLENDLMGALRSGDT